MNISFTAAALGALTAPVGGRVRVPALLVKTGTFTPAGCAPVTITSAHLDRFVTNFSKPVPVRLQHTLTPLDPFGEVMGLTREGDEVYGVLAFAPAILDLIKERGAVNLSVGINDFDADTAHLAECSLVITPAVPGAGFISPSTLRATLEGWQKQGKVSGDMLPAFQRIIGAISTLSAALPVQFAAGDGTGGELVAAFSALGDKLPVVVPVAPVVPGGGGVALSAPDSAPSLVAVEMAQRFGVPLESLKRSWKGGK